MHIIIEMKHVKKHNKNSMKILKKASIKKKCNKHTCMKAGLKHSLKTTYAYSDLVGFQCNNYGNN